MMLAFFASCSNQDIEFDDYTETIYFPIQYPIRTLVLGESRYDNEIDLDHAFSIGACVGGMYDNDNDITVTYEIDESIADGITNIMVLPSAYYAIDSYGTIEISQGSFTGTARVNLTDAYFDDPISYTGIYAIPLKITDSSRGEIITGDLADGVEEADANIHTSTDWSTTPKDFTLFAVKYINLIDGDFFRRGDQYKDGELDSQIITDDIEQNPVINMATNGRYSVSYPHTFGSTEYPINFIYDFENSVDGVCDVTFSVPADATYTVAISPGAAEGNNKCYDETTDFAQEYGAWLTSTDDPSYEYPHTTLIVDYTISGIEGSDYRLIDTLVFRNNKVIYEEFTPELETVE